MYNKSIVLLNELKNRKLLLRKMNRILFNLCMLLWKMVYIQMNERLEISFFKFETNDFYLYLLRNCCYQEIYIYVYMYNLENQKKKKNSNLLKN